MCTGAKRFPKEFRDDVIRGWAHMVRGGWRQSGSLEARPNLHRRHDARTGEQFAADFGIR